MLNKKILTIISILLFTFSLQAQNYFLKNPQWRQNSGCRADGYCITTQEFVYYINGDSIIGNKSYKKLYKRGELKQGWIDYTPSVNCSAHYSFNDFHALVRQEGKKIYIKDKYNSEALLYDFDLNIGGTLPITYNQRDSNLIVSDIDSIMIDSTYRKKIIFQNDYFDFIIEGVGHYGGFLEPLNVPLECGYDFYCFSLNDSVYVSSNYGPCNFSVDIENIHENEKIKIYPNPASNSIIIETGNKGGIVNIYNSIGSAVLSNTEVNSKTEINIQSLKPGLYIIEYISNKKKIYKKFIKK